MTMPSPILATGLMVATAVILAMRETVAALPGKSTVKVPSRQACSRQRHPENTKTQG